MNKLKNVSCKQNYMYQTRLDTNTAHVIVRWTRSDSARGNCMFYIPTSTASFPSQYGLGPRVNEPT